MRIVEYDQKPSPIKMGCQLKQTCAMTDFIVALKL